MYEILPNPSQQKAADEPLLCRNPPDRQELFVSDCKVSVQQEQFREGVLFFWSATRGLNLSESQAGTESSPAASGRLEIGGLATSLRNQGLELSSGHRSSALIKPGTCSPGALAARPPNPHPGHVTSLPRERVRRMACGGAPARTPGSSRAL